MQPILFGEFLAQSQMNAVDVCHMVSDSMENIDLIMSFKQSEHFIPGLSAGVSPKI
jgi:hypothetical protein